MKAMPSYDAWYIQRLVFSPLPTPSHGNCYFCFSVKTECFCEPINIDTRNRRNPHNDRAKKERREGKLGGKGFSAAPYVWFQRRVKITTRKRLLRWLWRHSREDWPVNIHRHLLITIVSVLRVVSCAGNDKWYFREEATKEATNDGGRKNMKEKKNKKEKFATKSDSQSITFFESTSCQIWNWTLTDRGTCRQNHSFFVFSVLCYASCRFLFKTWPSTLA